LASVCLRLGSLAGFAVEFEDFEHRRYRHLDDIARLTRRLTSHLTHIIIHPFRPIERTHRNPSRWRTVPSSDRPSADLCHHLLFDSSFSRFQNVSPADDQIFAAHQLRPLRH